MGRHSRPRTRAAHRRGNRGLARLVVILAAVLTLGTALYLSNMARDAALDGVSTPAPTTVSTPAMTPIPLPIPVPVPIPVTITVEPTPFPNCDAAHAAGVPLIPQGDPRYVAAQDHDGDGWACDRHGDPPTPPPPALPVCLPPP